MAQARSVSVAACILALALGAPAAAQDPEKPVGTTGTSANGEEPQRIEPVRRSGFVAKTRAWVEKQQEKYEGVTRRLERLGLSPEIGTLGQGSGLSAGLTYRRDALGGSPLDLETSAGYSYRGYELYDVRVGILRDRKGRTTLRPADDHIATHFDAYKERVPGLGVYAHVRYRHSPLHRFYGMGPVTDDADRTSFLMRGASYDLVAEYQRTRWLGFAVRGGILDLEVGPGRDTKRPSTHLVFDDQHAAGLRRQPAFAHVAGAVLMDGRDSVTSSRTGGMAGLMLARFSALNAGPEDLSFTRATFDGRYFVPATERSVVALRALASRDFSAEAGRVPFYLQQTLGGGDTLRGFERARFRDTSLVNLSMEYRIDVHEYVELAAFGDVGQVARAFDAMSRRRFDTSWGAGVRFKHKGAVKLRADWAFGREGQRLILSTGPVF